MTAGDSYLPDDYDPLETTLDDMPGGTAAAVPRLDGRISHGVGHQSQGRLLAAQITETAGRAEAYARRGEDDEARRHRAFAVGMLYAYNLLVRVVLGSEMDPRRQYDYEGALREVRADLDESKAFWDPIMRQELPPLERYHRLTKVQQLRPDASGLADLRAKALTETYRAGGWTYRGLAAETGLSLGRVQQLMDRTHDR
ncbi:hypothetical protein ACWEKM_24665 [Streptomyces sp. NPDC004752]